MSPVKISLVGECGLKEHWSMLHTAQEAVWLVLANLSPYKLSTVIKRITIRLVKLRDGDLGPQIDFHLALMEGKEQTIFYSWHETEMGQQRGFDPTALTVQHWVDCLASGRGNHESLTKRIQIFLMSRKRLVDAQLQEITALDGCLGGFKSFHPDWVTYPECLAVRPNCSGVTGETLLRMCKRDGYSFKSWSEFVQISQTVVKCGYALSAFDASDGHITTRSDKGISRKLLEQDQDYYWQLGGPKGYLLVRTSAG